MAIWLSRNHESENDRFLPYKRFFREIHIFSATSDKKMQRQYEIKI